MKKRDVPLKNYFILGILVIMTIILTFYFVSWYKAAKDYRKEHSIIADVIGKIEIEDTDDYLIDNPNIVIYIASSDDQKIKDFEQDFKKFILRHEITDDIVYIDTNEVNDDEYKTLKDRFSDELNQKEKQFNNKTNLLIVRDGEIIDLLYADDKIINESDVTQFLEMYEVIAP